MTAPASDLRSSAEIPLAWLLLGLFVAALTLRPQLIAIGPLFPRLEADLELSHGLGGLLSSILVLCMGVFAPVAPAVTARFRHDRAVTACILGIGVLGLLRAVSPGVGLLLVTTVGIGVAMGVAGALLPVAVKAGAAARPAFATGVYAAGIQLGAAGTAVAVVPAATVMSWRGALAAVSLVTVLCGLAWAVLARGTPAVRTRRRSLPVRQGFAWVLAAVFFLQAVPYFGLNAWLPVYLIESGWQPAAAGRAQGVMNVASLVASLSVPLLMDRRGSRRAYLIGCALLVAGSVVALIARPDRAWVLVVLLGLAMGVLFAVALVLPLDVAHDPPGVAAAAGLILGAGYIGAATAPLLLGAARDVAGGFAGPLWVIVASMIVLIPLAAPLSKQRLARGVGLDGPTPPMRSEPKEST
jgi:CP family cyanate transporter-like MFS transporter